jgi:hypothetical protein
MSVRILKKLLKYIFSFIGIIVALLLLYIVFNLNLFHKTKKLSSSQLTTYLQQLAQDSTEPYSFVAEKFDNHPIVFIGELHKRKQDLEFFRDLIPYLYHTKKINMIGWEFGAADYQKDADSVVTAPEFDRKKAIAIMRKSMYYWSYEEYLDIFKAIWELNKTISSPADKVRFLQLNKPYRPKYWNSADKKIMLEERNMSFDNILPGIIEKEVIGKNKKILIYCGLHHSLTKFKIPSLFFMKGDTRAGQILYAKYPDSIYQICLLSPFPPRWAMYRELRHDQDYSLVYPFRGVFNQLLDTLKKPFAVSSGSKAFAGLRDYSSFYAFDTWGGVAFKDFCDGAIMHTPFDKIEPVHIIPDWVTTNEEVDEVKSLLPDADAAKIKTPQDIIKYINAAGDTSAVWHFHDLKKFW